MYPVGKRIGHCNPENGKGKQVGKNNAVACTLYKLGSSLTTQPSARERERRSRTRAPHPLKLRLRRIEPTLSREREREKGCELRDKL